MKKKSADINSISPKVRAFRPKSKWKSSSTQTIRIPKVLAQDILKYALFLDNHYVSTSTEKFCLVPIDKLYLKLDEIQNSKKSLKIGIDKFKEFLIDLVTENEV
jgi:hypothetical protein